jgi:energy-coupling factor transporter ATP-binding protein EcfA2
MNIDGNIFADLRRGVECEGLCIALCGDSGSGKSTVLRRVIGAAHNAGWEVAWLGGAIRGDVPHVVLTDYHLIVKHLGSWPRDIPKGSVVVVDDIHVVWQLLCANGHQDAAATHFTSCPGSLLVTSVPNGYQSIVGGRTPLSVHDLSPPTPIAAFRYLRSVRHRKDSEAVCGELAALIPRGTTFSRLMEVVALADASTNFSETFRCSINPATQGVSSRESRLPPTHRVLLQRLELLCRLHVADTLGGDKGAALVGRTRPPSGILLHGPSGVGKTALLAQLEINLPGVSFVTVPASTLFGKYLGESESKLRILFSDARAAAPCVLVIDDIDVLGQRRSLGEDSGSDVTRRVLTALLCELDGFEEKRGVLVVGTTSVIGTLDGALLRQGRLETTIEVPVVSKGDCEIVAEGVLRSIGSLDRLPEVVLASEGKPLSHLDAALRGELEDAFNL